MLDFFNGLNHTYKQLISVLMTTVKLPCSADYDLQMAIHTQTENIDINLSGELKKRSFRPKTGIWSVGSQEGHKMCQ